jgi:oligopeptide transport system substrate-binding protein
MFYPVPRHGIERHGDAWAEPSHLISNGPFCLQKWIRGERLTLVRNSAYFGRFRGNLTHVEFHLREVWSPVHELQAYRADQLDILLLQPEIYQAREQHVEEYRQAESSTTYSLAFGRMRPPFADRRVRRALSLALDQDDFARQTTPGYFMPASGGFVPSGFPGHSPGIGLPFDPQRARTLLAEAGYPDGKGFPRTELLTPQAHLRQAKVLQSFWHQHLAIRVDLKVMDWTEFLEQRPQASMFLVGWGAYFYADPDYFLRVGVHALAEWWRHPDYEGLIQEASRIREQGERLRRYKQADRILAEEAPILPLLYRVDNYLVKPWVKTARHVYLPHASWTDVILEPH